jgi:hypothetical protein
VGLVALAWRFALTRSYYGSEEEDYGNLGLIIGTLQSGFTYVETEHMPLFTSLAAGATAITGDAETGGELVAVLAGSLVAALTTWIGWRWLAPIAGVLAGLLVAFQPDSALTAATPLRISTFVALSLLGVALLGERRPLQGAIVLALAFLARFDLAFTLLPALVLLAAMRRDRRHLAAVGLVLAVVIAWAAYYNATLGTWAFWGSVADRTTTGAGGGGGFATVGGVLARMLPAHLGWGLLLLAPVGLVLSLRDAAPGRSREQVRWLALCFAAVFGFFCLAIYLSAYRWDHNLFWKWLCASVPYFALFASWVVVVGLQGLAARPPKGRIAAWVLGLLLLSATAWTFADQTRAQMARSDLWYGTQVRLTAWVEQAWPEDVGLVADLIPATWLSRRSSNRRVLRWSGDEVPEDLDRAAFGAWLESQRISLVFTFDEEWVGSARKAPWLGELAPTRAGPVELVPIALEREYGFVAWQVTGSPALDVPSSPPPLDGGAVQVVVVPPETP